MLGHIVIADCVNPVRESRAGWRAVAARARVGLLEVELVCSDRDLHRRRAEARESDIQGLAQPSWAEIAARDYDPWPEPHLVIDTAVTEPAAAVALIEARIAALA